MPTVIGVALNDGGVAGTGHSVTTYSERMDATRFCSAWDNSVPEFRVAYVTERAAEPWRSKRRFECGSGGPRGSKSALPLKAAKTYIVPMNRHEPAMRVSARSPRCCLPRPLSQ